MSRRKPEEFSPEFFKAIESFSKEGEVCIPCSLEQARNLRSSFYHFRRVLRDHEHPLTPEAYRVKFEVDGTGLKLKPKYLAFH
jgi:hypothetical protein